MMATGNITTPAISPPTNGNGATGQPTGPDQATIPVAASAGSLVLVLLAIVLWYFLVRGQLRKKHFRHQRTSSHHSQHSHQGSVRDANSRHSSLASRCHSTPRTSPRSHRRSNGSPRSKRSSRCTCQFEACACPPVRSSDSPLLKHSPKCGRSPATECTGTSPFCPHSTKFRVHQLDIHLRDSMDSDCHPDDESAPGPSHSNRNSTACTCSSDAVVNMDAVAGSSGSQTNGESGDGCRQPANGDRGAVCSCSPVSQAELAKHCTCRVIPNPLDGNGRNPKRHSLNQSAPALIGSSSDSDFPGAEAL